MKFVWIGFLTVAQWTLISIVVLVVAAVVLSILTDDGKKPWRLVSIPILFAFFYWVGKISS